MKERYVLDGIIPAMNIPFLEDDRIDIDGLCAQVENGIEAGVVGFMVPVFASEVNSLSMEEKTPNVRKPIMLPDEYQQRVAEERVELAIQLIEEIRKNR